MRFAGTFALAVAVLLAGCAQSPVSGRSQFIALPSPVGTAQSEILFGLNDMRLNFGEAACEAGIGGCGDAAERKFRLQVARIAGRLAQAAHELYPQVEEDAELFKVSVVRGMVPASAYSASGRIALTAALRTIDPSDDLVAFIIARDMGHVLNRHEEENSSVGMVGSVLLGLLVPVQGLLKMTVSFFGSRVGSNINVGEQGVESDLVAMRILARAGYSAQSVALSLALEASAPALSVGGWGRAFCVSALRVAGQRPQQAPVCHEVSILVVADPPGY